MVNRFGEDSFVESFDDIRPYRDSEISGAMHRIAESSWLSAMAEYVFPDSSLEEVRSLLHSLTTIDAFQRQVMYHFNRQVIKRSVSSFTCDGLQWLSPNKSYMYVSNHRDIVLDASLLQNALVDNGFQTTEITFGANLMCHPLIVDIGKSNKMFRVERGGRAREFYRSSLHLSQYMRHVICHEHVSVWIAQRNGRTKNGIDATDPGLVNMFSISGGRNKMQALAELHIVPVSVSYEWEPCDLLKAKELFLSRKAKYVKQAGEDIHSILTGIMQSKGRVHFEICRPLQAEELMNLASLPAHDAIAAVTRMIDKRIIHNYRLMPTHYIAYDLMHQTNEHAAHYSSQERNAFIERLHSLPDTTMRDIFLGIYANPVISKRNIMRCTP